MHVAGRGNSKCKGMTWDLAWGGWGTANGRAECLWGEAARQGSQALDDSRDDTDILEGSEQGLGTLQIGLDMNKAAPSVLLVGWTVVA